MAVRKLGWYRELKSWARIFIGAGLLTIAAPLVVEVPPSAGEQCEVALAVDKSYIGRANLTRQEQVLLADARRELNDCMR